MVANANVLLGFDNFLQILAFLDFRPKVAEFSTMWQSCVITGYLTAVYLNDKLLMKKGSFIDFWVEMPRYFHNFNQLYLVGTEDDSKFYTF